MYVNLERVLHSGHLCVVKEVLRVRSAFYRLSYFRYLRLLLEL
jgi:hypothetical protein